MKETNCNNQLKIYIEFKKPDHLLQVIVESLKKNFGEHKIELEVIKLENENKL